MLKWITSRPSNTDERSWRLVDGIRGPLYLLALSLAMGSLYAYGQAISLETHSKITYPTREEIARFSTQPVSPARQAIAVAE